VPRNRGATRITELVRLASSQRGLGTIGCGNLGGQSLPYHFGISAHVSSRRMSLDTKILSNAISSATTAGKKLYPPALKTALGDHCLGVTMREWETEQGRTHAGIFLCPLCGVSNLSTPELLSDIQNCAR